MTDDRVEALIRRLHDDFTADALTAYHDECELECETASLIRAAVHAALELAAEVVSTSRTRDDAVAAIRALLKEKS